MTRNRRAFSLVEALLCVVLLVLAAGALTGIFASGFQSLDVRDASMEISGHLRGKMEELLGTRFSALTSGSAQVGVNGENQELIWSILPVDLDEDGVDETDAVRIEVELGGQTLRTLMVDAGGKVARL